MPCFAAGPSQREERQQLVCQLLIYLMEEIDLKVDEKTRKTIITKSKYASGDSYLDKLTDFLCSTLKSLPKDVIDKVVYDGRNPKARKLADWWDAHQESDRRREEAEIVEAERLAAQKSGLAKLTNKERKALGL